MATVQNSQALVEFLEELAAVRGSVSSQTVVIFFSQAGNGVESRANDSNEGNLLDQFRA